MSESQELFEALTGDLVRWRDTLALDAQAGDKRHSGSGSWWEFGGYADVLSDALTRLHSHRKRVERQDQLIQKTSAACGCDALGPCPAHRPTEDK